MINKEEFECFVEQLLDNAEKNFKATEQYKLLQEKLDQMNRDCDTMLTKDEKDFVVTCFELILDVEGQKEYYIYRKGLEDCISILRELGVLA